MQRCCNQLLMMMEQDDGNVHSGNYESCKFAPINFILPVQN